ncbi:MAG TPA: hypothetical protein VFE05_05210 [Longimicrobiaceae bacterium]|jgi:uncharacterized membrane protein|nr:hypothetical protein [Longimicrobiaceae bacterium]
MRTFILQIAVVLLKLVFGIGCIVIAKRSAEPLAERRAGWLFTGFCFTLTGVHGALQSALGGWAMLAGAGSAPMRAYLRVQPVANHGRGFAMVGFASLLCVLLARGKLARAGDAKFATAWLGSWMVAGSAWGMIDGGAPASQHYGVITYTSALTVLVMLVALYLAVVRDSLDHLLWLALATYTVREVVDVSITTAFSFIRTPDAWVPSFSLLQVMGVLSYVIMLGLVGRRFSLMSHGSDAPSLSGLLGGGGRGPVAAREPRL